MAQAGFKYCLKCRNKKPAHKFNAHAVTEMNKDGLQIWCKHCEKKYSQKKYQENREERIAKATHERQKVMEILNAFMENKSCISCQKAQGGTGPDKVAAYSGTITIKGFIRTLEPLRTLARSTTAKRMEEFIKDAKVYCKKCLKELRTKGNG